MAFEDYQKKQSVAVVYTGDGKGKTSASLGMLSRALGRGWRVAYIQFIKDWEVGEHTFIHMIEPLFNKQLTFYKGGKGFFAAGELSAEGVSEAEHESAALHTYNFAVQAVKSGDYDLVICDEINNAAHDGLITTEQLATLFDSRASTTSLCATGRHFPPELLAKVDIATGMMKIKHHFDDKFLANEGIDF